jgi:hypothetical protein
MLVVSSLGIFACAEDNDKLVESGTSLTETVNLAGRARCAGSTEFFEPDSNFSRTADEALEVWGSAQDDRLTLEEVQRKPRLIVYAGAGGGGPDIDVYVRKYPTGGDEAWAVSKVVSCS